jgi:rare lipoprotein A
VVRPGPVRQQLSCGGRLTPGTLGVAHKTLPCGTRVTLRRGDRVIRVRVVDRGPYVGGREFDLTSATHAKLHFGGVGSLLVAG